MMAGNRKLLVAMTALVIGGILGLTCEAGVVNAFAMLAAATVSTYMGAHAVADSKWANPGKDVPHDD